MKKRVRKVQKRYRVAGGKESFVLGFLFLKPALSLSKGIKTKEKNTVFKQFNLQCYIENFT